MKKSIIIFLAVLTSCIGGGTHGSIKGYEYPVTKETLEKAVNSAIRNNSTISRQALGD